MAQTAPAVHGEAERLSWYRTMRDTQPVARDEKSGRWDVFRYQDVAAILADHRTFSSDFSVVMPAEAELMEGNILAMDPPRHNRLRSLVSKAFTPAAIGRLEGRIAELTEELLDGVAGRTRIELVDDLAYPLPVTVIAEMLGVPAEDRPRFKEWADALLARDSADAADDRAARERAKQDLKRFSDYLQQHVTDRRARRQRGGQDLLSDLVAAEIDGERLDDQEIVGFATVLLIAGHITTTALLGNAIRCFDEHPEAQATLRADPDAMPVAIEEVLRYRSPFALTARVTATEVRLGDQAIPPKQMVGVWLLSANRDERQFPAPDAFRIDRQPNAHLGFGRGVHFCLGAPLARLEARVALSILLRRYARIEVDPDHPLEPYPDPAFNSLKTLHLRVEPA